jgi:RsiW-degrading membrane proteinase PrsW (M82 family)
MTGSLGLLVLKILVSLLPVLIFLLVLVLMDSYKLVKPKVLALAILGGAAASGMSYFVNSELIRFFHNDFAFYSRYVSPLIEESLKAVVLLGFFKAHRIGFLVDAAILGFAAGAGFSLFENIYYLNATPEANLVVWVIRGFGTAMMHGGTTAIFAAVVKTLSDRRSRNTWVIGLPGLGLAYALHSAFNHFILPPIVSTAALLVVLPLVSVNIFFLSEKSTRKWLDVGFDSDVELLAAITEGRLSMTKIGKYLLSLKDKFAGEVVADMFCLIRIHLELSISAKGILLMKEAGLPVKPEASIREKFDELTYLEKSVGKTGRLAIGPILHRSRKDLWELHMLGRK